MLQSENKELTEILKLFVLIGVLVWNMPLQQNVEKQAQHSP